MKPNANKPRQKPDLYRTICLVLAALWVITIIVLALPTDAHTSPSWKVIFDQEGWWSFCLLPLLIIAIIVIRLQDLRKAAEQAMLAQTHLIQDDDYTAVADDALASKEMTALLHQLNAHFDESELRALCFDLHIEPENLPGQTRQDRARALIRYMLRRGRIGELYTQCETLRPNERWRHPSTRA